MAIKYHRFVCFDKILLIYGCIDQTGFKEFPKKINKILLWLLIFYSNYVYNISKKTEYPSFTKLVISLE